MTGDPVLYVTCNKHSFPMDGCTRCADCRDMNTRQALALAGERAVVDEWGRWTGQLRQGVMLS